MLIRHLLLILALSAAAGAAPSQADIDAAVREALKPDAYQVQREQYRRVPLFMATLDIMKRQLSRNGSVWKPAELEVVKPLRDQATQALSAWYGRGRSDGAAYSALHSRAAFIAALGRYRVGCYLEQNDDAAAQLVWIESLREYTEAFPTPDDERPPPTAVDREAAENVVGDILAGRLPQGIEAKPIVPADEPNRHPLPASATPEQSWGVSILAISIDQLWQTGPWLDTMAQAGDVLQPDSSRPFGYYAETLLASSMAIEATLLQAWIDGSARSAAATDVLLAACLQTDAALNQWMAAYEAFTKNPDGRTVGLPLRINQIHIQDFMNRMAELRQRSQRHLREAMGHQVAAP